jgi:hypothetical protein
MSAYEWRNPRGSANTALEKLSELPVYLLQRRALVTGSAKRRVWLEGEVASAVVLLRPKARTTVGGQAQGVFRVRVTSAGGSSYEAKTRQSYSGWEWDLLAEGVTVECRVADGRVLLCAPEPPA